MKSAIKILFSCIASALFALASCTPDTTPGSTNLDGVNYIIFSTEGTPVIYEADNSPLVVDVTLTAPLEEDLVLDLAISDRKGVVGLVDNKLVIKAGDTNGQLQLVSKMANRLTEATPYLLGLDLDSVLPLGVLVRENFEFTVTPFASDVLNDSQKAVLEAFKAKTGVDLSPYLGFVEVSTVFVGTTNGEPAKPLKPEKIKGKSVLVLSAESTNDLPILEMKTNAMGLQDKMYQLLRAATIENQEWSKNVEEGGVADYKTLMDAIKWTKHSMETFTLGLEQIKFESAKNIVFLGKGRDHSGKEISIVPFSYQFTAYERELAAIADNTLVKGESWAEDATAAPFYHLNCEDVAADAWGIGNWVDASATVSDEQLQFVFCFYPGTPYKDCVRVTATYTPIKPEQEKMEK